jgi:hypothetical protein
LTAADASNIVSTKGRNNKGQKVITSRPAETQPVGGRLRPADECRWRRPFPEGFDACPAYLEQRFIPVDINDQPLTPVRTCRHLLGRRLPDRPAGWYAACLIGDASARQQWLVAADGEAHRALGALRARMDAINRPFVERIWAAKALQRDEELRAAVAEFVSECATFLTLHRLEFEQAELRPDAILLIIQRTVEDFASKDGQEASWDVPESVLSELPEPDRLFFRLHASS